MSEIKVGDMIEFTGYVGDDVDGMNENMVVGEKYEVIEIDEADDVDDIGYVVKIPKKGRKKAETVALFFDELKVINDEAGATETAPDTKSTTKAEPAVVDITESDDDFVDVDAVKVGATYDVQLVDESVPVFTGLCTKATKTLIYIDNTKYKKAEIDALFKPNTDGSNKGEDGAGLAESKVVGSEEKEQASQPKEPDSSKADAKEKRESTKKSTRATTKTTTRKAVDTATKTVSTPPASTVASGTIPNEDEDIVAIIEDTEDLCGLAKECLEDTAMMEWRLGGVLHHVYETKAYEALSDTYAGKGGFERYCINDLGVQYRKARYLINIYVAFSNAGLTGADLASIGWTKARTIIKVMNDDNAADLLALAADNTVDSLLDEIKVIEEKLVVEKGTDEKTVSVKKMSMKFNYYEDQASFIAQSLDQVMSNEGLETEAEALYSIVARYMTELFAQ